MAYEFYCNLEFQSGFISGMLAGKPLNCLVNPSQPGSAPVEGVYQIQPPIEDVVFGQLAVMTPVGGAYSIGEAFVKDWVAPPSYSHLGGASVSHIEKCIPASASLFDKLVGAHGGAASFVLSSRPIPGRNCLVIQSNFADFMDALKTTGGATVRFA